MWKTINCIGHKCHYHFSSDIYQFCTLCENYILSGQICNGVDCIEDKKYQIKTNIDVLQQRIISYKKQLDILRHLRNYIGKNQHLIWGAICG